MNESISSPFIRYPIGTSLLMAGILFVGLVAYPLLPGALRRSTFRQLELSPIIVGDIARFFSAKSSRPTDAIAKHLWCNNFLNLILAWWCGLAPFRVSNHLLNKK